jgi:hypothetical protein
MACFDAAQPRVRKFINVPMPTGTGTTAIFARLEKVEECREAAEACLQRACRAASLAEGLLWLDMSERWSELASING